MELNFEPNSSVLSCARVRGEKKQTEKCREAMKARENSVSEGHGYDYFTSSGIDSYCDLILKWVRVVYNDIKDGNLRMVIQATLYHNQNY